MVLHVLNKKPFETRPLFFFSIQLFFAALCLDICLISVFILMAHDVDIGERQKKKEEKPVTIEFFPHVKPFVFI